MHSFPLSNRTVSLLSLLGLLGAPTLLAAMLRPIPYPALISTAISELSVLAFILAWIGSLVEVGTSTASLGGRLGWAFRPRCAGTCRVVYFGPLLNR